MKKTLYYKFIPSKTQEEACKASNSPWQVRRCVVEIRDVNEAAAAVAEPNPWGIKRVLSREEVFMGRIVVPFVEAFEHVFQHWTVWLTNRVVRADKVNVVIWDVTNQIKPKRYHKGVQFQVLDNHDFALSCSDLFVELGLVIHDQIGLLWDPKRSVFLLNLIHKAVKPHISHK